jgi:alpha-1,3-fucosyltransferase
MHEKKLRGFFILFLYFLIILQPSKKSSSNEQAYRCQPILLNAKHPDVYMDGQHYPQYLPMFFNHSYNFTCLNQSRTNKLILYWNKLWGQRDFLYGIGKHDIFFKQKCPVTNCELSDDKSRLNESSMILFYIEHPIANMTLPKWRHEHQRWIFHMYTPATYRDLNKLNGLFNLTATHRLDSNFTPFYPHNLSVAWDSQPQHNSYNFDEKRNYLAEKTQFAFQISSNCKPSSQRDVYIREMQKYVAIDVYGKCGRPCPNQGDVWLDDGCKSTLSAKYKFYLAFENAICKDYVSEKLFSTLNFDVVPVVYGGGPYDKHIPKSGYINAFDFESPKHLTEYMTTVASNADLYSSYFKWKQYIRRVTYPVSLVRV